MSDQGEKQDSETEETPPPSQMQVNVKMQQGEQTGQPIYSNFTVAHPGQGVVFVDFGFLDPQTIHTINRIAQSGDNSKTVNARMSCRMAISLEAANQLTRQLNQLLQVTRKAQSQHQNESKNIVPAQEEAAKESEPVISEVPSPVEEKPKPKRGFKFPWSSSDKTH